MKIKKCPACGSLALRLLLTEKIGLQYVCDTCGYRGPLASEENIGKEFGADFKK